MLLGFQIIKHLIASKEPEPCVEKQPKSNDDDDKCECAACLKRATIQVLKLNKPAHPIHDVT